MSRFVAVLVAMLCLTQASAHICLTYPMMRGPHPSLYPGDELCYQRTPDCGALVKGPPTATFVAGIPTSLRFQQNLNHFYQPRPGYFDISVSYDNEKTWEFLAYARDYAANNMNTQTNFNIPAIFHKPAASAVVRARYVSYNPNEIDPANNTEAIFYSCSDVEVVAPGNWGPSMLKAAMKPAYKLPALLRTAASKTPSVGVVGESCVTPPRWSAKAVEYDVQGSPVMDHQIAYDTIASMVKWTRIHCDRLLEHNPPPCGLHPPVDWRSCWREHLLHVRRRCLLPLAVRDSERQWVHRQHHVLEGHHHEFLGRVHRHDADCHRGTRAGHMPPPNVVPGRERH